MRSAADASDDDAKFTRGTAIVATVIGLLGLLYLVMIFLATVVGGSGLGDPEHAVRTYPKDYVTGWTGVAIVTASAITVTYVTVREYVKGRTFGFGIFLTAAAILFAAVAWWIISFN